jgi:hypothetical protein
MAGFDAAGSVIAAMAGFAGASHPQPPGRRTATPASFKYVDAVSRRTPTDFWMRRSDQPRRPNAMTCCFFSSLKTLLTMRRVSPSRRIQCPERGLHMAGFQAFIYGRFWVFTED